LKALAISVASFLLFQFSIDEILGLDIEDLWGGVGNTFGGF
jgi:hypothetical protein